VTEAQDPRTVLLATAATVVAGLGTLFGLGPWQAVVVVGVAAVVVPPLARVTVPSPWERVLTGVAVVCVASGVAGLVLSSRPQPKPPPVSLRQVSSLYATRDSGSSTEIDFLIVRNDTTHTVAVTDVLLWEDPSKHEPPAGGELYLHLRAGRPEALLHGSWLRFWQDEGPKSPWSIRPGRGRMFVAKAAWRTGQPHAKRPTGWPPRYVNDHGPVRIVVSLDSGEGTSFRCESYRVGGKSDGSSCKPVR
jgi:hypothetical protein